MGLILSRIYNHKPSTRDTLEKIEQEIQNIEERRWDKIKREQFIVQILSFLPITIFIANVCILIYPSDSTWRDKLLLSIPIVIINLILWVCKKIVQWYSRWSLDNEEARFRKLQKEKKKILEMVCETESYRVATELLEKYDPKQLRRRERPTERPNSPLNTTLTKISASPIRSPPQQKPPQNQTNIQNPPFQVHNLSMSQPILPQIPIPAPPPPTPVSRPMAKTQLNTTSTNLNTSMNTIAASSVQGRPVRPILSKDRTLFEKVVDWVVADGPDYRFALICRFCYGHNGMSLAEEYETINFRCCYCYNLNTATGKRHQVHDQLQSDREKSEHSAGVPKASSVEKVINEEKVEEEDKATSSKKDSEEGSKRDKSNNKKVKSVVEGIKTSAVNDKSEPSAVVEDENKDKETTCDNNNEHGKETILGDTT